MIGIGENTTVLTKLRADLQEAEKNSETKKTVDFYQPAHQDVKTTLGYERLVYLTQ